MDLVVRPRVAEDVPALCELVMRQQPLTQYPFRNPLPFPVEDFVVRPGELAAWVAELEPASPVGHVSLCEVGDHHLGPRWAEAVGRPVSDLAAVSVLVLVGAGAITFVTVRQRYADAEALSCVCAIGWGTPDSMEMHRTHAGFYYAMNVVADPTRKQVFYAAIVNTSPVTQTILGEANPPYSTPRLAVSGQHDPGRAGWFEKLAYSTRPVDVAPNRSVVLRYSVPNCVDPGVMEQWEGLDLKVRVGWFTRTERIDFGDTIFVVHGSKTTGPHCHH